MEKINNWFKELSLKRENRKLKNIKWGVQLYFVESLERLLVEDLWTALEELENLPAIHFESESNRDCLNIYLYRKGDKEEDYLNRQIFHINSENVLIAFKHYDNYFKQCLKNTKKYLKEMEKEND